MLKKFYIYITVFVCGAIVMALELIAARILSPYVGSSNLIWTSIIGIILISMSLGYYLGGKIADKRSDFKLLAAIIAFSAFIISIIPIFETEFINLLVHMSLPLIAVAIISAVFVFSVPSILLAMVSPYAIKLMQVKEDNVGRIAGRLSAISTLGSIFGTFFTGFVLIPLMGVKAIILACSILLLFLSLLLLEKHKENITIILIIGIIVIANVSYGETLFYAVNKDVIADTDSEYSRLWVRQIGEYKVLQVDTACESYLKEDGSIGSYLEYYDLFDAYIPDGKDTLIIGGAAYTYPMYFLNKFLDKNIDVVEIDKKMTSIAREYFGLKDNERLNIYHQDGRSYINSNNKKYDAIFVDAFKGHNVPFELTTVEAFSKMKDSLKEKGVVMVNVISPLEGEKDGFIKHEFATFSKVFDAVKLFDVSSDLEKDKHRNLILVGFNYNNPVAENGNGYEGLLINEVQDYYSNEKVFTDDYAPVEQYVYIN